MVRKDGYSDISPSLSNIFNQCLLLSPLFIESRPPHVSSFSWIAQLPHLSLCLSRPFSLTFPPSFPSPSLLPLLYSSIGFSKFQCTRHFEFSFSCCPFPLTFRAPPSVPHCHIYFLSFPVNLCQTFQMHPSLFLPTHTSSRLLS